MFLSITPLFWVARMSISFASLLTIKVITYLFTPGIASSFVLSSFASVSIVPVFPRNMPGAEYFRTAGIIVYIYQITF